MTQDRSIIIPAAYVGQPDATLSVESDAYGDAYTLTLSVAGRIVAQGEGFRPGASRDFGDGAAAAYTAQTFGSFLAHAVESSDPDAREGWTLTDEASDWTDALTLYGEGNVSESDAMAYLMRHGNLAVPCSRYGDDTEDCAPVAYRLASMIADANGEPLTLADIDYAMGLVVNDHDDVADLLGHDDYPACPTCSEPIDYCQGHGEDATDDAYLALVASEYTRQRRDGASDADAMHVAFGLTPVPDGIDALSDPSPAECARVRELAR